MKPDFSEAPKSATHYSQGEMGGLTWLCKIADGVWYEFLGDSKGYKLLSLGSVPCGLHEIPCREEKTVTVAAGWPTDERIDTIGQNGNDGEHYPGRKDDTEKPMMNLIPAKAEMALARVLSFGAKKYAPENWRLVDNPEQRYMAAAMRHMNAHRSGELRDEESGELHLSHALTCLAFLVELEESK